MKKTKIFLIFIPNRCFVMSLKYDKEEINDAIYMFLLRVHT